MANKSLSSLHNAVNREYQAEQEALHHDVSSYSPLSGEHEDLLAYYFGEPSSTEKGPSYHQRNLTSRW